MAQHAVALSSNACHLLVASLADNPIRLAARRPLRPETPGTRPSEKWKTRIFKAATFLS